MNATTIHRLLTLATLLIVAPILTTCARAQVPDVDSAVAHMGVGAGITFIKPTNSDGNSSQGVAFVYRWHSFHSGWGPSFGIDWHSTDFNHSFGSVDAPFGTLRTRALLLGYGHTQRIHRFSASASVSGGYSFNDFSTAGAAGPAAAAAGVSLVGVSIGNSAVLRPDVAVWYDVFRHVGVGVSAAYLVSRPTETMTTAIGSQSQRLRADAFELTVGVAVGVWKKR
jgi:hypothetical protein